jgi:uncharacterized protein (TIGR04255 family)
MRHDLVSTLIGAIESHMKKAIARRVDRLPNAPLAEVVFELRWGLPGVPPFQTDPGLLPLCQSFTNKIRKLGYPTAKDMARPQETIGYGVIRRFFVSPDKAYPIMQIGQGIFASNQSSEYEWKSFKKQVLLGLRVAIDSYPKLEGYALKPNLIELRYVDLFDETLLGTINLIEFCNRATTMSITPPKIFGDPKLDQSKFSGRIIFQDALKGRRDSEIIFDLGSGRQNETNKEIVRLETKVVTRLSGVPKLKSTGNFVSEVGQWLEFAHDMTSPFFKDFIKPDIMKRFEAKK